MEVACRAFSRVGRVQNPRKHRHAPRSRLKALPHALRRDAPNPDQGQRNRLRHRTQQRDAFGRLVRMAGGRVERAYKQVIGACRCCLPRALHRVNRIAHQPMGVGRGGFRVPVALTFDQAGSFEYNCALHPGMKGVVEVQ